MTDTAPGPRSGGLAPDDDSDTLDIWLGSQTVEPRGEAVIVPGLSDRVMGLAATGRPVIIIGRNSGSDGRRGCELAANDFRAALDSFRLLTGIDLTNVFPPPDELAHMLFGSRNIVRSHARSGSPFSNRFAMIRVRGTPWVAHLSAGSGFKLNSSLEQPHAVRLERVVREEEPAVLFAKRADRMVRNEMALSKLWHEVCEVNRIRGDIVVGDGRCGIWRLDFEMQTMLINVDLLDSSREVKTLKQKKADGQRRYTSTLMVDGKADYSGSNVPPPGMTRYRDTSRNQNVVAVDEAALEVDLTRVSGFSMVTDAEGSRVCTAEIIMDILEEWGRNGQDLLDLFPMAVRRHLTSDHLRALNGSTTYWCGPTHHVRGSVAATAAGWATTMRANLDFYKTGDLTFWVGPEPGDTVTISGCFPSRGYWLTKEALDRIDLHEARRAARPPRESHLYSWAGLDCTLDGLPYALAPRPWAHPDDPVEWLLRPRSAREPVDG